MGSIYTLDFRKQGSPSYQRPAAPDLNSGNYFRKISITRSGENGEMLPPRWRTRLHCFRIPGLICCCRLASASVCCRDRATRES